MKNQQLSVRLYGKEIGILEQNGLGKLNFIYKEDNIISISNSLPLKTLRFCVRMKQLKYKIPYSRWLLSKSFQVFV